MTALIARYWNHMRLLCGAPLVTGNDLGGDTDGDNHYFYAGGVDSDSATPMMVYANADHHKIQIIRGTSSNFVHEKLLNGTGMKAGLKDLLVGEADEQTDFLHIPQGFAIGFGLVVAFCEVRKLTSTSPVTWTPWTTSVCYWQRDPNNPPPVGLGWKLIPFDPAVSYQPGMTPRGSYFQSPGFRILDSGSILKMILPFSDYVNQTGSGSTSGNYYAAIFTRATESQSSLWQHQHASPNPPLKPILTLPAGSAPPGPDLHLHAHAPFVDRFGTQGLRVVCPVGDSWWNNRDIALFRNDENLLAGPASSTDTGTDPPTNGWTTRDARHGSARDAMSPTTPVKEGNQFVGSAQLGPTEFPMGQLTTGDESIVPIARTNLAPSNNEDFINFHAAYVQTCASWNRGNTNNVNYVYNTFMMGNKSLVAGGPYCAYVFPGNQSVSQFTGNPAWKTIDAVTRILYSSDGLHWGQCWNPMHASGIPLCFFGNRIYTGSQIGSGRGIRSIPKPTVTAQKPLCIGRGGNNKLLANVAIPVLSTIGANNNVTKLTSMPTGVLAPPCTPDNVFRCTVGTAIGTGIQIGVWRLTSDVVGQLIPASSRIKLRLWVLPMPWVSTGSTPASRVVLDASVGKYDTPPLLPPTVEFSRERFLQVGPIETSTALSGSEPYARAWIPITIDTDTTAWKTDGGASSPPAVDFPLGVRLTTRRGEDLSNANPCDFLVAFDYVLAESTTIEHPQSAIKPQDNLGAEVGTITNFTTGKLWTFQIAGEVPPDAWDLTDTNRPVDGSGDPIAYLFTLRDTAGTGWLRVRAVKSSPNALFLDALRFDWSHGGSVTLAGLSPDVFCFLRNSPVLIGISCNQANVTISASVGGTRVSTTTSSQGLVKPTQLKFGDASGNDVCPMLWYGGRVDETTAFTQAQLESSLQQLSMLYQKYVPLPPA